MYYVIPNSHQVPPYKAARFLSVCIFVGLQDYIHLFITHRSTKRNISNFICLVDYRKTTYQVCNKVENE